MKKYICTAVAVVLIAGLSNAQTPDSTIDLKSLIKNLNFDDLKRQAEQQDTALDFSHLRLAFSKTRQYDPYGTKLDKYKDAMREAFGQGNYEEALRNAHEILEKNFVDIRAHMIAAIASDSTNLSDSSSFHRWMWTGLVKSIMNLGDGKSDQTAYVVISVDEEYRFLEFLNHKLISQGVGPTSSGVVDHLRTVDLSTGRDTVELYFNVDLPWKKMKNKF